MAAPVPLLAVTADGRQWDQYLWEHIYLQEHFATSLKYPSQIFTLMFGCFHSRRIFIPLFDGLPSCSSSFPVQPTRTFYSTRYLRYKLIQISLKAVWGHKFNSDLTTIRKHLAAPIWLGTQKPITATVAAVPSDTEQQVLLIY